MCTCWISTYLNIPAILPLKPSLNLRPLDRKDSKTYKPNKIARRSDPQTTPTPAHESAPEVTVANSKCSDEIKQRPGFSSLEELVGGIEDDEGRGLQSGREPPVFLGGLEGSFRLLNDIYFARNSTPSVGGVEYIGVRNGLRLDRRPGWGWTITAENYDGAIAYIPTKAEKLTKILEISPSATWHVAHPVTRSWQDTGLHPRVEDTTRGWGYGDVVIYGREGLNRRINDVYKRLEGKEGYQGVYHGLYLYKLHSNPHTRWVIGEILHSTEKIVAGYSERRWTVAQKDGFERDDMVKCVGAERAFELGGVGVEGRRGFNSKINDIYLPDGTHNQRPAYRSVCYNLHAYFVKDDKNRPLAMNKSMWAIGPQVGSLDALSVLVEDLPNLRVEARESFLVVGTVIPLEVDRRVRCLSRKALFLNLSPLSTPQADIECAIWDLDTPLEKRGGTLERGGPQRGGGFEESLLFKIRRSATSQGKDYGTSHAEFERFEFKMHKSFRKFARNLSQAVIPIPHKNGVGLVIEELLGVGGDKFILRARDNVTDQKVALKVFMSPQLTRERLDELWVLCNHEKDLLRLFEGNGFPTLEFRYGTLDTIDGWPCIVEEYISGGSIDAFVQKVYNILSGLEKCINLKGSNGVHPNILPYIRFDPRQINEYGDSSVRAIKGDAQMSAFSNLSPNHSKTTEPTREQPRHKPPEPKHVSPEPKHVSPEPKHVSPEPKHVSPEPKHVSPEPKHVSPAPEHVSKHTPWIVVSAPNSTTPLWRETVNLRDFLEFSVKKIGRGLALAARAMAYAQGVGFRGASLIPEDIMIENGKILDTGTYDRMSSEKSEGYPIIQIAAAICAVLIPHMDMVGLPHRLIEPFKLSQDILMSDNTRTIEDVQTLFDVYLNS
ncbi:hypothetical protein AAMO2058_000013800 [Amorphochlora amoebiformis]